MAKLKTVERNAALDAITSAAGTTCYLFVYAGAGPGKTSNVFNPATGTLLSKHAMSNPIGPASALGVLTCSAIASAVAVGTGTPGYARLNTDSTTTDGSTTVAEFTAGVQTTNLGTPLYEVIFPGGVSVGTTVTPTLSITEGNA